MILTLSECSSPNQPKNKTLEIPEQKVSQLLALRFFLATDAACFPRAVRVAFGRWAIVRFSFAAPAALTMFFLAAFFCFC
jgi:hypothetical protein